MTFAQPRSLVGRLALWALVMLAICIPLFWVLFSAAVERVSKEVVDTRLLEFADQVRGYWISTQAEGIDAGGPARQSHAGVSDVDWVWQIAVSDRITMQSELLNLTGAHLETGQTGPRPDFTLRNIETNLGLMRIAERMIDEILPFAKDASADPVRVHYIVGLRTQRYQGYVSDHAARLRGLALLAMIPVAFALFGLSAVIILVTRRDLGRLTEALHRYEAGDTDSIEGRFADELQIVADRVNALLLHNQKLVERTRKYVSKIAHDINHPLAIMKNALQRDYDPELMQRQLDRMVGLVDRYSSLARAIGPDGQVVRQTLIGEMIDDVVSGFSILYRRSPLAFESDCDPELSFAIPRHDLEAMVSNLVSNAHKYSESKVRISATLETDGALLIAVEDDGPGIPAGDRDAALNWGKRLDEAPPGTGFGLSIVRDIADLYQGRLILDQSKLGGLYAAVEIPKTSP